MANKQLNEMVNALINGDTTLAEKALSKVLSDKTGSMLNEDAIFDKRVGIALSDLANNASGVTPSELKDYVTKFVSGRWGEVYGDEAINKLSAQVIKKYVANNPSMKVAGDANSIPDFNQQPEKNINFTRQILKNRNSNNIYVLGHDNTGYIIEQNNFQGSYLNGMDSNVTLYSIKKDDRTLGNNSAPYTEYKRDNIPAIEAVEIATNSAHKLSDETTEKVLNQLLYGYTLGDDVQAWIESNSSSMHGKLNDVPATPHSGFGNAVGKPLPFFRTREAHDVWQKMLQSAVGHKRFIKRAPDAIKPY